MAGGTLDLLGGLSFPPSTESSPQQAPIGSQLTIFYSGAVNVYNDVPADKAHAIMLLLTNGSGHGDAKPSPGPVASIMPNITDMVACDSGTAGVSSRSSAGAPRELMQPFNRSSTPSVPSPYPIMQPEKKRQLVSNRSQAELPFARKASLARFLEKRKDRVQAKLESPSEEEASGRVEEASGGVCKKMKLTAASFPLDQKDGPVL